MQLQLVSKYQNVNAWTHYIHLYAVICSLSNHDIINLYNTEIKDAEAQKEEEEEAEECEESW